MILGFLLYQHHQRMTSRCRTLRDSPMQRVSNIKDLLMQGKQKMLMIFRRSNSAYFSSMIRLWEGKSKMTFGDRFLAYNLRCIRNNFKIKRYMFRLDRSDDRNCCRWKSTSGFDGKMLFAHILRTNRRILEIQTANV